MKPTFLLSFKIFWSLFWRTIIVSLFAYGVFAGIAFLTLMLIFNLDPLMAGLPLVEINTKLLIAGILGFIALVIGLYVYKWVLNCLPEIEYREGKAVFMKHDTIVEKFSVFDMLCVWYSIIWRSCILMLPFILVYMIFVKNQLGLCPSSQLMSVISIESADLGLQFVSIFTEILAIKWMLFTKYTGRWIRLEARENITEKVQAVAP